MNTNPQPAPLPAHAAEECNALRSALARERAKADALRAALRPFANLEIAKWSVGGWQWWDPIATEEHAMPARLGEQLLPAIKAARAELAN